MQKNTRISISADTGVFSFVFFIRFPFYNVGNMIRFVYQDSNHNMGNGKRLL